MDLYSSTTFNINEYQPLSMTEGPLMCLMVDSKVKPIVYHSPLPVLIISRSNVKARLDRDVRLEVLEHVPAGKPVTWYHTMA